MNHSLFIHFAVQGHLVCFLYLSNYEKKVAINICMHVFCVNIRFELIWINMEDYNG